VGGWGSAGYEMMISSRFERVRALKRLSALFIILPQDSHPPPLHPYTRALSSFSAVVQLYARSAQLPTNLTNAASKAGRCFAVLIVSRCSSFQHLRDEYSGLLISEVERALSGLYNPPVFTSDFCHPSYQPPSPIIHSHETMDLGSGGVNNPKS
jgi:hypothetical protein